jgi:hypothetical protein
MSTVVNAPRKPTVISKTDWGLKPNRKQLRAQREFIQQERAFNLFRRKRKEVSKDRREVDIDLARSAKIQQGMDLTLRLEDEEYVSQSGAFGVVNAVVRTAAAVGVARSISKLCSRISATCEKTGESTADVLDAVSGFIGKPADGSGPESLRSQVGNLVEQISSVFTGFVDAAKSCSRAFWLIPSAIFLYTLSKCIPSNIVVAGVLAIVGAHFFPKIWSGISKWFVRSSEPQAQAGTSDLGFLSTLVCLVTVPTKNPQAMAGEIMRRASVAERSTSGFTHIFDNLIKISEKLVNTVLKMFGKEEVEWTDRIDRMLRTWSVKVDDFEKTCVARNPTLAELKAATIVQQEGVGMRQLVRTQYARVYLDKYLDRLAARLQPHMGAMNNADAFRQQPIFTLLGGGSGIGKTSLLKAFALSVLLLADMIPASEAIQQLWQKGISDYWNGYIQQLAYVMDDAFQLKMNANTPDNEAMTVIRSIGNFAFPLNYADVESKGRFYFNSPLVVGTTNVANVRDACAGVLAAPEAVTRRIAHGYWVYLADDYKLTTPSGTVVLDYEKLTREWKANVEALTDESTQLDVINCMPWKAWRIVHHDFNGLEPSPTVESSFHLGQLAMIVADQLKGREKAHQEEVEDFTHWLKKIESLKLPKQATSGLAKDVAETSSHPISEEPEAVSQGALKYGGTEALSPSGMYAAVRRIVGEPVVPAPATTGNVIILPPVGEDDCIPVGPGLEAPFDPVAFMKEFEEAKEERKSWVTAFAAWVADSVKNLPTYIATTVCYTTGISCPKDAAWLKVVAGVVTFTSMVLLTHAFKFMLKVVKGLVSAVWGLFADMFGLREPEEQSNTKEPKVRTKARVEGIPRFAEQQANSQLGVPPKDVMADLYYKNCYKVLITEGAKDKDGVSLGQVLFLEGDLAVMPAHFYDELQKSENAGKYMRFYSCDSHRFDSSIPISSFLTFKNAFVAKEVDLVYVKFNKGFIKASRHITHLLLTEAQMAQAIRQREITVRLDTCRIFTYSSELTLGRMTHTSPYIELVNNLMVSGVSRDGLLKYTMPTELGDCGSPLSIAEPKHWGGRALLGIHVAGQAGSISRFGMATILTQENVAYARSKLSCYEDSFINNCMERDILVAHDPEGERAITQAGLVSGSMTYIGTVDKPLYVAGKSKIKQSAAYGLFDDIAGPCPNGVAHLKPFYKDGTRIEPMAKAMSAYQSPLEYRPVEDMQAIVDLATGPHFHATRHAPRYILTFDQAVVPDEPMKVKNIPRDTSPGYPYRLAGDVGKKGLFGSGDQYELKGEKCAALREDVARIIDAAKRNVRLAHLFVDFLKDELRPLHKVEHGATRAISGAAVDYTIAVRMYFGAFLAAMFSHHTESGMAPGINHYTEWSELANNMVKFGGEKVFGGDFSRFDASEQPYVHMHILGYINRWYKFNNPDWCKEDEQVRDILWLDLIHSRHLTGLNGRMEHIVQWNKSLPSGHPLTTPVNSLYSLITLTACYVHSLPNRDVRDMWNYVYICTFGDDNIVALSDTVAEVFNQTTVAKKMDELFGLVYTSDKKEAELIKYESIEDITFLKRSFSRQPIGGSAWSAPLVKESFLYTPYWYKNSRDQRGDLYENMTHCLGEMCLHEESVWETYFPPIEAWATENDFKLPFYNRETARAWIATRADVWY